MFDSRQEEFKEQTDVILEKYNEYKNKIEELYGVIGEKAISGHSKTYADKTQLRATILFLLAFGVMAFVTGILLWIMFSESQNNTFDWKNILYRIPTISILYIPAWYLASEARKQRDMAFELRDAEIKIATLDPYLKNIDLVESKEEQKNNVTFKESEVSKEDNTILEQNQSYKDNSTQKLTARDVKIELAREFFSKRKESSSNESIIISKDTVNIVEKLIDVFGNRKNK